MRNALAALAMLLAVAPEVSAEDAESRRMCVRLLAEAVTASGNLLAGFVKPGLSIPAHTFRAESNALNCLFLSDEGGFLYAFSTDGKKIAFKLEPNSVFEIK